MLQNNYLSMRAGTKEKCLLRLCGYLLLLQKVRVRVLEVLPH